MFEHPAKKLKATALAVAILGMVASVVLGAAFLVGAGPVTFAKSHRLACGLAVLLGGLVASWVVGLALYGFGELIEKTKDNNYMLSRIAAHTKNMLDDRDTAGQ